jgi:hypothetical protein
MIGLKNWTNEKCYCYEETELQTTNIIVKSYRNDMKRRKRICYNIRKYIWFIKFGGVF